MMTHLGKAAGAIADLLGIALGDEDADADEDVVELGDLLVLLEDGREDDGHADRVLGAVEGVEGVEEVGEVVAAQQLQRLPGKVGQLARACGVTAVGAGCGRVGLEPSDDGEKRLERRRGRQG